MAAGTIDLSADLDRIYLAAFEKRGGLNTLYAAIAAVREWDLDLSDRIYEIYLSHVRHVVAARRDIAYFRTLSEHVLRVRDSLKRSNPSLARRISVLEDMVDEALAALPSSDRPERSRKHVAEILTSLHEAGTMSRADLRRRHGLGDANMSRILRALEEEGLIARWQNGREVTVGITALGREELGLHLGDPIPKPLFDLEADNSPETLANYAIARLSPSRLADRTDEEYPVLFGRDLGATLARYCGSGEQGERKFNEVWTRLIDSPLATLDRESGIEPPEHGRFRLAIMSLLQFWAREAADTNALLVRRRCAGLKKALLVVVLDLGRGHWARALEAAEALRQALEAANMPAPQILIVGVSGYHEERIIGKLASDIFLLKCGYDGLQLASSPWASEGTVEGVNEQFGHRVGSADVRLVSAVSLPGRDTTSFKRGAIFRHLGYRAFASQSWLLRQRHAKATPDAVREWIDHYFAGEPDLSLETLPQRAWLCLKGRPINYPNTEFPEMLRYLSGRCDAFGSPGVPALAADDPDPDDVFEQFLTGASSVLLSGSIHDLLLEEYWTDHGKGFVKLLDKGDFADWYRSSDVGLNYIKFSDRLPDHIETLVHQLYAEVLAATVKIAKLKQMDLRRALFAYVATILAPSHRENWNTEATDTRWSFAASLESVGRLLLEELEPCVTTTPKRPHLKVVASARG
ncbi:MAG: hypothetical protein QOI38_1310 [Sphingomonadales bacterium]|jgi:DNA-binding MarR family transcriptional regulator|nr:hypothetical protein [Sphingomonadales bacterium]